MKENPYTLDELKGGLRVYKATGEYKGRISNLNKSQLMGILTNLNFPFSSLPSYNKGVSKTKGVKKRGPFIGPQNFVENPTKKRGRPKKEGPTLPKGITYKSLAESYATKGNTQLNKLIKATTSRKTRSDKGKKRGKGRPKGSKNKPK